MAREEGCAELLATGEDRESVEEVKMMTQKIIDDNLKNLIEQDGVYDVFIAFPRPGNLESRIILQPQQSVPEGVSIMERELSRATENVRTYLDSHGIKYLALWTTFGLGCALPAEDIKHLVDRSEYYGFLYIKEDPVRKLV